MNPTNLPQKKFPKSNPRLRLRLRLRLPPLSVGNKHESELPLMSTLTENGLRETPRPENPNLLLFR